MSTVYVLNKDGKPLMPTTRCGHVRRLLKEQKARVVTSKPFTIQLLYETNDVVQPLYLGIDPGRTNIGVAAVKTDGTAVFTAHLETRNKEIPKLMQGRKKARRARRNRKTRYRAPRFNNRVHSKHKGWLAPSVEVKIQEHITVIKRICRIIPISLVRVETAEFDTQRLKAMLEGKSLPVGTDYQLGEMYDEYNVRQYVLKRDNYTCQCCGAHTTKKKTVKLHVHHFEGRQVGGNAPNNLITLCVDCHKALHAGKVKLDGKKRGKSFKDAAFMGIMRKTLMARLRDELPIPVQGTYGYITKMRREQNDIKKSHVNDARCISKHPLAEPCSVCYRTKAIRHHNRQTHKANFSKGGTRQRSQMPYVVEGYRLWDKVLYKGQECFVSGRRASGSFTLKKLDGTRISKGVTFKKLRLLEPATNYLIERM